MISKMKDIAEENRRLESMYAEMSMQNDLLKDTLGKSADVILQAGDGYESGVRAKASASPLRTARSGAVRPVTVTAQC
ncbi:hypothetical protein LCGC14_0480110 [marine sediment metagenome]|uniref:Uncharacterized protein n=2 Tax=root TaxID=1 RepID=A0A7V1BGL6_9RHOB|nr:hypothetical protein [Sulfitobacter litoralis]